MLAAVRKALSKSVDPNQVEEVVNTNFDDWPVIDRGDCLLLKGPFIAKYDNIECENFVIIVQSNTSQKYFFTVLRTVVRADAERLFTVYKNILPCFLAAKPELCCKAGLQKLCDAAREHPDYALCHIAVLLDMIDLVSSQQEFKDVINQTDDAGVTAIMLAARTGSKHLVAGLVDNAADLKVGCDVVGDNVMHYIADKSLPLLEIVGEGKHYEKTVIVELLNTRNHDNMTPVQKALKNLKTDMVQGMLRHGADLHSLVMTEDVPDDQSSNIFSQPTGSYKDIMAKYPKSINEKDMLLGGSPLHWTQDSGAMDALIQMGCDMRARNQEGMTAVHKMVEHQRLSCLVVLLSHGADPDSRDVKDGDTPLHVAMRKGYLPSIQALVVFNADYNLLNKAGDTPWLVALKTHQQKLSNVYKDIAAERNMMLYTLHSVGANGPSDIKNLADDSNFDWQPPVTESSKRYMRTRHLFDEFLAGGAAAANDPVPGQARVLALDGGGIKGLVLAKMLESLCKVSGERITDMFDWITGTSTGGILALALACHKTPLECQSLYFKLKDKVFVGSRPYNVEPLEEFLKKEFTETLLMTELPKQPMIAVTATMSDRYPADLHFFRNYDSPMEILGVKEDLLPEIPSPKKSDQQTVWRAARSSGAAPSYFSASGRFIDGGLIANNPTMDILTEIHERNCALNAFQRSSEVQDIGVVVSLGTGDPPVEKITVPNLVFPSNPLGVVQMYSSTTAMARVLVDQATSTSNRVVDRARAWCTMAKISYFRLTPLLASDISLDCTDDETLVEMLWMTQTYCHENRAKLKTIVDLLNKCSTKHSNLKR